MAMSQPRSEGGRKIDEIVWSAEELNVVEKPNGPAAAALLAAAFGSLVMGILTTWAEAYTGFADKINLQHRVGPLSGKVTFAGLAFVIAWVALSLVLWKRNLPWTPVAIVAAALIGGGFTGTFPKFFDLFAPG
jgi:fluoride ion exporter CrcB/FEX